MDCPFIACAALYLDGLIAGGNEDVFLDGGTGMVEMGFLDAVFAFGRNIWPNYDILTTIQGDFPSNSSEKAGGEQPC